MIVIFKNNANPEQVKQLCAGFEAQGLKIHNSEGEHTHLIGLIGDTSSVDIDLVRANDFVEDVKRVSEPYKKVNRKFHPADTAVDVAGHTIGGGHFSVMAGPCSVESESQIVEVARDVPVSYTHLDVYKRQAAHRAARYTFSYLFTMRSCVLPVARSIYRTNSETLLSSFRLFQTILVNVSISPIRRTCSGSPAKLGMGLPSQR